MRRLLLTLLFAAVPLAAQTPADAWKTVETPHFRLHYPAAYETWALRAASRLEPIREAVARETGYAAPQKTDVVVMNPAASANGLTLPLLDAPRVVLFAETPGPGEEIGEFADWIDLLITHELTHVEHLVRPSRNPAGRLLAVLLPAGPIALGAPRWVDEGYATLVEGRVTGSGRPSSSIRAAILRKWSAEGQLPTYGQLSSDRRFLGMSMAYLAGSAYLEWLEERAGEGSLRNLWARMTARRRRSFDEAFEGVFGDSPQRLYGRFLAELTERAVSVNRAGRGDLRQGESWQETSGATGDPVVSPDGGRLAVVLRDAKREATLVVLSTAPPAAEEAKQAAKIAEMLRRDPADVAPVRSKPLDRKPLASLRLPLHAGIATPRWMPDGRSILFSHRSLDRHGDRHHDLYLWTVDGGAVRQVTREADVFDADPLADGLHAVAVRARYGATQLVTVDLATGDVTPLMPASIDRAVSHPRIRGGRIAYAFHEGKRWLLAVRDLAAGSESAVPLAAGSAASPEWSRTTDDLFATVSAGGMIEIHRFSPGGEEVAVTRVPGAAMEAAPSPDGRLFFMSLEPQGKQLRVLSSPSPAPVRSAVERPLEPAVAPVAAAAVALEPSSLPPARPYGAGRQEPELLLGGNAAPSAHTTEVGLRWGDVVGRFDGIAVLATGSGQSQRGGTVAVAWRGLPVELRAQAYTAREGDGAGGVLRQRGFELRGVWRAFYETVDLSAEGGGLARSGSGSLGFATARARFRQYRTTEFVELAGEAGAARHARLRVRGETTLAGIRFGAEGQHDEVEGGGEGLSDGLTVGGIASTILPRAAFANRVPDPALETATLTGSRYTGFELDAGSGPLTLFRREHRTGERLAVTGAELTFRLPATPMLKFPAIDATAGGARAAGRNRWWITIRLEP